MTSHLALSSSQVSSAACCAGPLAITIRRGLDDFDELLPQKCLTPERFKAKPNGSLETARKRLSGLKSINPKPNFGPTLDIDKYAEEINAFGTQLDKYNETVSLLDAMQNELDAAEASINDKNKRVLAATGATYGDNSNEYEQVGGTRSSDRKRPARKKGGSS